MKIRFIVCAFAFVPALAFASGNTINFQGEVTEQTCSITVNGNAANPTVLLPTVPAASLASAGSTAGETTFTVGLNGCTTMAADTNITTVFVGNQVTSAGNLVNTGSATNVALQLLDPKTPISPFNLSNSAGVSVPGMVLTAGSTSASYDYAVQYISEQGGATAGSVLASVQYAVSYQ